MPPGLVTRFISAYSASGSVTEDMPTHADICKAIRERQIGDQSIYREDIGQVRELGLFA